MTEFAMIIGGTRVRAASEFDVMNPSTGKLIAKAPNASAQDLDRAVAAATSAFELWSKRTDAHSPSLTQGHSSVTADMFDSGAL